MSSQEEQQQQIKKLPQHVIDKIAAGEVIQKPYSVVKELVENSIDAGSSRIEVKLKDGGLSEIWIEDNGKGIHKSDFTLLCERFATSKITHSDDLNSLNSFGFRGEALASVSYVSRLQITSQKPGEDFSYQSNFKDSKMIQEPEIVGGKQGTIIKVNDLFYNLLPRRKSVNYNEEKRNVQKLIASLAVHFQNVQFLLKIDKKSEFSSPPQFSRHHLMGQMSSISANSFVETDLDLYQDFKCRVNACLSNLSATKKFRETILFINDRLVINESIRKAVDRGYNKCYESIHNEEGGYFVYLSLKIKQQNLDPNVHPTKKEVKFLFENEIGLRIENFIYETLRDSCKIKSMNEIQSKNNGSNITGSIGAALKKQQQQSQELFGFIKNNNNNNNNNNANNQRLQQQQPQINYPQQKVRNDPTLQKIDRFFVKKTASTSSITLEKNSQQASEFTHQNIQQKNHDGNCGILEQEEFDQDASSNTYADCNLKEKGTLQLAQENKSTGERIQKKDNIFQFDQLQHKDIKQSVISQLQKDQCQQTQTFFTSLTYVGCISSNYILAQYNTNLYLMNSIPLINEVVKSLIAKCLGNLESEFLDKHFRLKELFCLFLDDDKCNISKERWQFHYQNISTYADKLQRNSHFLKEFFGIILDDEQRLVGFPQVFEILKNKSQLDTAQKRRGYFLLKIAATLDFNDLQTSTNLIIKELAHYFAWQFKHNNNKEQETSQFFYEKDNYDNTGCESSTIQQQIQNKYFDQQAQTEFSPFFEMLLFAQMKKHTIFSSLSLGDLITPVLKLEDIYKIFERC